MPTDNEENTNGANQGGDCFTLITRGLFPKKQKGAARGQEEQQINYSMINTSSRRAKRDTNIYLWRGLTTKRHTIWSLYYG